MNIFAGKTPTERNKLIAAIVLGVLALISLLYTFGGLLWSPSKTKVNVSVSPSPTATVTAPNNPTDLTLPTETEINSEYLTTPIVYNPSSFFAPQPGRNIFAFYEPPPPTPVPSYTPVVRTPTPFPTPTPAATPPIFVSFVTPQSVYAGTKSFRLEVNGDKFTPESQIFFNAIPLQTNYVSPQKLTAQVPENYITNASSVRIYVATPDGKLFSNESFFNVQAPPKPNFTYIGLIARRHNNNDTAFFQETGKNEPTEGRLNDVVGGRFRIMSISVEEVKLQDTRLGFPHTLKLERPNPGASRFPSQPPPEDRDDGDGDIEND